MTKSVGVSTKRLEEGGFNVNVLSRKMDIYQLTDPEIESLGALSRVESIVLNIALTFTGAALGALSGVAANTILVWVVFFSSFAVAGICFILFMLIRSQSNDIRREIKGEKDGDNAPA